MDFFGSLCLAFSLYSRIPVPGAEWNRKRAEYALCFFPAVGLVIGALVWGWIFLIGKYVPGYLGHPGTAAFSVSIPVLVSGGIHLDGYADVTDARMSFGSREKKLQILSDPHIGAFAVIGLILYFLLTFAFVSFFKPEDFRTFSGVFVLERALSGYAVAAFPKAKKEGMAAGLAQDTRLPAVKISTIIWVLVSVLWILFFGRSRGFLVIAGVFLTFLWFTRMSENEFGGITGDLAGYFLQSAERNAALILAAAGLFGL